MALGSYVRVPNSLKLPTYIYAYKVNYLVYTVKTNII